MTIRPVRSRLLVLVAALALLGAACGDDDDVETSATSTTAAGGATPGENLDLVSEGRLTACTDIPYAPFEFEQDGKFDGIDIELVRAVAGRLGLTAEFKDVDFESIFAALNAGECDIVASSVSITPERLETLDFSEGYYEINQSLLVRKGEEATLGDLDKLAGRTIGVQSETTGAAYARANAEGATIREFTGADELFTALRARQVDAALQDLPVNSYNAKTTGETVVAKVFTEAEKEQYGFAMKKGSAELKAAIDDALEQVKADDTYPTILRRFLGDTAGAV
ncbi:MAG TPA: transporter substrate-binding domain-containing protein [Acidimicrobiales bacterium]|jgi:polar amino acid transport system substrate-binding protein|nr:transporter substrate-binding domain-containing protein [Acidimicrobiales bacterium]